MDDAILIEMREWLVMLGNHSRPEYTRIFRLAVIGSVLCGLICCTYVPARLPNVRKRCVLVAMFDLSESVKESRPRYEQIFFDKVLKPNRKKYDIKIPVNPDLIDAGDTIYLSEINTSPETDATAWVDETLPDPVLSDYYVDDSEKDLERGQKNLEEVENIKIRIGDVIKKNLKALHPDGTPLTGIIASTRNAAKIFERKGGASHKHILLLFTDGVEESKTVNFNQAGGGRPPATSEELNKIIETLKQQDLLKEGMLTGVDVYVIGATGGRGSGDTSAEFIAIKRFWEEFFKQSGANVIEYGQNLIKLSLY